MQVTQALAAAEPYKEQLLKRGVLVVPLPIFSSSSSSDGSKESDEAGTLPPLKPEDLRWRVTGINPGAWWVPLQQCLGQPACKYHQAAVAGDAQA
jgi:hypothetical protein